VRSAKQVHRRRPHIQTGLWSMVPQAIRNHSSRVGAFVGRNGAGRVSARRPEPGMVPLERPLGAQRAATHGPRCAGCSGAPGKRSAVLGVRRVVMTMARRCLLPQSKHVRRRDREQAVRVVAMWVRCCRVVHRSVEFRPPIEDIPQAGTSPWPWRTPLLCATWPMLAASTRTPARSQGHALRQ